MRPTPPPARPPAALPSGTGPVGPGPGLRPSAAAAPSSPGASPPSPAPAAPPPPAPRPGGGWPSVVRSLNPFAASTVAELAAFQGADEGNVSVIARTERAREQVRKALAEVDWVFHFPGFQRLVLQVGEAGRTGREARTAHEQRRLEDARKAAEGSAVVQRLLARFGGRIEAVEPAAEGPRDMFLGIDEEPDEQSP